MGAHGEAAGNARAAPWRITSPAGGWQAARVEIIAAVNRARNGSRQRARGESCVQRPPPRNEAFAQKTVWSSAGRTRVKGHTHSAIGILILVIVVEPDRHAAVAQLLPVHPHELALGHLRVALHAFPERFRFFGCVVVHRGRRFHHSASIRPVLRLDHPL